MKTAGKVKPATTGNIILLLMIMGILSQTLSAQDQSVSDKISQAIKAGNAAMLSDHLNASIDLSIPNNEGTYSKKQAEQILKMFFSKNPAESFELEHSGNSNSGSTYLIGSYKSKAGKTFRVYMLIKARSGNELIQQLKFEEE
jgi:hypothetical protein